MTDMVAGAYVARVPDITPLRRQQAAQYLRERHGIPCSPNTLAKYAVVGGGPEFRKAGRYPVYLPPALDAWIAERLSAPVRSTSELATLQRGHAAVEAA